MKMKIKIKFFLFLLFLVDKSFSQTTYPTTYPTPNTASFGIFSSFPESTFSGVPSIQIPLYNFTYQGISLPITLSYNTNLVKPNSYGSWVGMGWSLSSGGLITRVENDLLDDVNWYNPYDYGLTREANQGYFYRQGYLAGNDWASSNKLENAMMDMLNYQFNQSWFPDVRKMKDYAPDEFSFNIGSLSGSFYFSENGTWKVRCDQSIKVVINPDDFTEIIGPEVREQNGNIINNVPKIKYLSRITLIDNNGIKYVFGGNNTSIEKSYINVRSWYISNIIFPNGKSISYKYDLGQTVHMLQPTGKSILNFYMFSRQTQQPVYLKSITTDLHEIKFTRSEMQGQFAKLDYLEIIDKWSKKRVKKVSFLFQNNPMDRLTLTSIEEYGNNEEIGGRHVLNYNSQFNYPFNMSQGDYKKTDHWGYYSTKPFNDLNLSNFINSRSADVENCHIGLLSSIQFPTGGKIKYSWESHDYMKEVSKVRSNNLIEYNDLKFAGGVRIKKIETLNENDLVVDYKEYKYVSNYESQDPIKKSSGVLNSSILYNYYIDKDNYEFINYLPLVDNNSGSVVNYSEVTEINSNGGFTITKFSNYDNGFSNEYLDEAPIYTTAGPYTTPVFFPKYIYNSHERGFPLSINSYSSDNKILRSKIISYERFNKNTEFVKAYYGSIREGSSWLPPNFYQWYASAYKIYTNSYLPKIINESFYDINGLNPVTTVKNISYDNYKQISKLEIVNSKNETNITEYYYPYNVLSDLPSTLVSPNKPVQYLYQQNIISEPVEEVNYKKINDVFSVVDVTVNTYRDLYEFGSNFVVNESKYKLNISEPVNNYQSYEINYTPSSYELETKDSRLYNISTFTKFDTYGNPSLISKSKSVTSYTWGYNGSYMTGEIKNAVSYPSSTVGNITLQGQQEYFLENFEESIGVITGGAHTGNKYYTGDYQLNFSPTNFPIARSFVYSYWYKFGDTWSFSGELPYTGNVLLSLGEGIDDIRIHPVDAQMTTYTYEPLVGMTSMTDASGRTTYYEYDSFQRLRYVRDQNKNILKANCYNYAGQSINCFSEIVTPPISTTIYARMEYFNDNYYSVYNNFDDYSDYHTAEVTIKLYSDAACTVPYTLTADMNVSVETLFTYISPSNFGSYTYPEGVINLLAGSSSISLGTKTLESSHYYYDPNYGYVYDAYTYQYYTVNNGTNNYISQ